SARRGSWFKRLTANDVVWGLVIANAGVFLLWRIASPRLMVENFMISLDNFRSGRIHTLVTSAFSHKDFGHLFSNMLGLYFFGVNLYLWGATGGSVLYLLHHYFMALSSKEQGTWRRDPSRVPGLGASGAVNAIMLLEIFLNPRATIMFDFIIPVPAMLLGVFVIGKDVWRIVQGDSNISGSAHLGGAAVAAVAWYRIRRGRF
ncbi:RHOMBOID-like protein 12, mitochondrial, partial [Linum perenne]